MKQLCFAGILLSLLISPVCADNTLLKPSLVNPKEGAVFENYPRTAAFSWEPVQWASKYRVDIQCEVKNLDSGQVSWIDYRKLFSTQCHAKIDNFAGAQRGRWRVTAIDATGVSGQSSEWRTFRFTK